MNLLATPARRLLLISAIYVFANQIGAAVFFPFLRAHFSFAEMVTHHAVANLAAVALLPLFRGYRLRTLVVLSFVVGIGRMLFAPAIDTLPELWIYSAFVGLTFIIFWIPFEIVFFEKHDPSSHGMRSAWYFLAMTFPGVIVPAAAGFVADSFGHTPLFVASAVLMVVPLILSFGLPARQLPYRLGESLRAVKGVKALLFFDGLFFSVPLGVVGLSLLNFTKTASGFGTIASLVAVGSLLASMAASKMSDKKLDRAFFIYPVSVVAAVLLVAVGATTSIIAFTILLIIYNSLRTVIQPIVNALPMDLCADHARLYVARQWLISIGRLVGLGTTFAAVWLFPTRGLLITYIFYALGYLAFILIIRRALRLRRPVVPHPVAPES